MSYPDAPIANYLDDLASNKPAPGGGSAAALAAALGAALGSMVANFTVGKEKFAAVEDRAQAALQRCEELRATLTKLVQDDVDAYSGYSAAAGRPRATEAEKAARQAAIQEALHQAASVPMEICRQCAALLEVSKELLEIGNPNLISDVGCAAELAYGALRAASLNVEVNHAFIKDEAFIAAQNRELEPLLPAASRARDFIWEETRKKIAE